jgi:hypothetical protein
MDLLRAQTYLGLLLGTLPLIPPPDGAAPDDPPAGYPSPGDPGDDPLDDDGVLPPADDDLPAGDDGVPPLTDDDAPAGDDSPGPDDDDPDSGWAGSRWAGAADDDDFPWRGPVRNWPALPALIPPAPPGPGDSRPAGLVDVCLPWRTLAGISPAPGHLGRIGPITATQARHLAECAVGDPGAEWRVIVTNSAGQALAVTRVPRARGRDSPPHAGRPDPPGGILARAMQAAATAAARTRDAAAADAAAGGCAHTAASPGYRPPPRLREQIAARDLTCRLPVCRQPAWRGDLDHTVPFDNGGITCACNLGGVCRADHQLKQHPGWNLTQTAPGIFLWTTPSGRTHTATPDTYPT